MTDAPAAHSPAPRRRWGAPLLAGATALAVVLAFAGAQWLRPSPATEMSVLRAAPPAAQGATTLNMPPAHDVQAQVLVVTLDGAEADYLQAYVTDGTMENLALLASGGAMSEYLAGVQPPQPAASHASLATGSRPATSDIPGDRYRVPGAAIGQATLAEDGPAPAVAPLWAWQDGGADALLFWPGGRGPAAEGAEIVLELASDPTAAEFDLLECQPSSRRPPASPKSYSPALFCGVGGDADVDLVALDTTDDDVAEYDSLALSWRESGEAEPALLQAGGWATLAQPDEPAAGVAFKLLSLARPAPDADWQATIYRSAPARLAGEPEALVAEIAQALGPPAPPADPASLAAGWLSPADAAHMAEANLRWKAGAIAYVLEHRSPRLALASLDALRQAAPLTATLPDGPYAPAMRRLYGEIDAALRGFLSVLDLSHSTVLVGALHGYLPATATLNLAPLLESAAGPGSATSYSSGGAGFVVVGRAGREKGGTVAEGDYDRVVNAVATALRDYRLGETPAFERVAVGDELRALGISPDYADVFVQAAPGIILADADPTGEGRPSWPYAGAAPGYDAERSDMHGLLVIAGAGVEARGLVEPLQLVDLAPTVGYLLGWEAPASVEGRVLHELLRANAAAQKVR